MESNRAKRDSVLLTIQNNTPANQKVILFDSVGAFKSQNALNLDTLYQWDFTGYFGLYNEINVIATPSGGSPTNYTYLSTTGAISDVNDLVAGLNSLGIGMFYVLSGNTVGVYGGTSTYTYTSIDLLNNVQFTWAFTINGLKTINIDAGLSGTINWGDGTITSIVGGGGDTHTYSIAGSYNVVIEYDGTLTTLYLLFNDLTIFNPTSILPSSLIDISLSSNKLTSFTPTVLLPITLQNLDLGLNPLLTSGVNNVLIYLDNIGYSAPFTLFILQFPPAPPSGLGITAKNNLISRGCTITTD